MAEAATGRESPRETGSRSVLRRAAHLARSLLWSQAGRANDVLRIRRDEHLSSRATLRLEGRLGSAELELLRGSVEPCLASGREVELDLLELRFLDDPGARLLSALRERGVTLKGATGYVHELLCALENER